jgi:hypothetical protein
MENLSNYYNNSIDFIKENTEKAKLLAIIGLIAIGVVGCSGIEIPEDCDEDRSTIIGAANNLFESGFDKNLVQEQVNQMCH